jgi:uncharacterized protein involved in type VI secretion and phage assembly
MISGVIVGIVENNVDPDKMNRVLVRYPVASEDELKSSWCRMCTPCAGPYRGMVMLPDVGTEVALAFAYRSLTPYILGALYNGTEDSAEPYRNDDLANCKRVFWSRNDHMVIFDDTPGAEKVQLGAQAPIRLLPRTGRIHHTLNSASRTIKEYCSGDTIWEAGQTVSIRCTDFELQASGTVDVGAGMSANLKSSQGTTIESTGEQRYTAMQTAINPSRVPPDPAPAMFLPSHKHGPSKF